MSTAPTKTRRKPAPKKTQAEKPALEGHSQEEAARIVGCAQSTVSRAIARGDIEPLTSGRLPESAIAKLRELRRADAEVAAQDSEWDRRLLQAQAAEREAKARLKQIELERESGRYVELAIVQRDAADTAERILAVLRAIPQRTAMALECECQRAAVIEKKVGDEIERAVAELRDSLFMHTGA